MTSQSNFSSSSSTADTSAQDVRELCAKFARPHFGRALWQLINTLPPFIALWGLMAWSLYDDWNYGFTLLLMLPTAGLFVRMFIIQHDCGHGSFFANRHANRWVGACLGVLTLFPYGYWKKTHAIHHGTSGNLDRREFGDVRTLTLREYEALSRFGRFSYRFYRSMPVMLGIGPSFQLLFKHRVPFDLPWSWKREWASVLVNNSLLLLIAAVISFTMGWQMIFLIHLPLVLVAGAAGVWLFYVQHAFDGAYWSRTGSWDAHQAAMKGSAFYNLPKWLHWFTGNIGYHHIHHLAPRIPNYRLQAAYASHRALQEAPTLTLRSSLRCARVKLWDESQGCMIGFPKRARD